MRNFVRKHMNRSCIPKIQQSKRRQALMAASVQDEDERDFNTSFPRLKGNNCLDSECVLWDDADVSNDIGVSSIDIGGDEE